MLEQLIAALSPRRAYERELWRQGLDGLRGYDAASPGRLNAGWRVHNESAELTDRQSRDVIRARARDLERNSDIAQAVLSAYKRNVVGKGYTLRARTGDDQLNNQIERVWRQWCKARNCDVTGEQSFHQILRMLVERKKIDGGMLVLFRYTRGGVVPFKLQALEVDELDTTRTVPKTAGNRVVGGVEYNRYRRPVGYWIRQYDIEGWQLLEPVYLPAKDVFFCKTRHRPSQLREMSDMAHTVTRIRDTNEFITAVSVKERIAACLAVLIKKTLPTGGVGRGGYRQPDGAVDLERLNSVGVLLFNHKTDVVVGKVLRAWVEDHRGMAEVEFDSDQEADKIFGKVQCGTLKTTSVRYAVDSWEEVAPGKTSADGRFTGPCQIARKWTPLEVSIVSVPADATVGVGRMEEDAGPVGLTLCQRQIQINQNRFRREHT